MLNGVEKTGAASTAVSSGEDVHGAVGGHELRVSACCPQGRTPMLAGTLIRIVKGAPERIYRSLGVRMDGDALTGDDEVVETTAPADTGGNGVPKVADAKIGASGGKLFGLPPGPSLFGGGGPAPPIFGAALSFGGASSAAANTNQQARNPFAQPSAGSSLFGGGGSAPPIFGAAPPFGGASSGAADTNQQARNPFAQPSAGSSLFGGGPAPPIFGAAPLSGGGPQLFGGTSSAGANAASSGQAGDLFRDLFKTMTTTPRSDVRRRRTFTRLYIRPHDEEALPGKQKKSSKISIAVVEYAENLDLVETSHYIDLTDFDAYFEADSPARLPLSQLENQLLRRAPFTTTLRRTIARTVLAALTSFVEEPSWDTLRIARSALALTPPANAEVIHQSANIFEDHNVLARAAAAISGDGSTTALVSSGELVVDHDDELTVLQGQARDFLATESGALLVMGDQLLRQFNDFVWARDVQNIMSGFTDGSRLECCSGCGVVVADKAKEERGGCGSHGDRHCGCDACQDEAEFPTAAWLKGERNDGAFYQRSQNAKKADGRGRGAADAKALHSLVHLGGAERGSFGPITRMAVFGRENADADMPAAVLLKNVETAAAAKREIRLLKEAQSRHVVGLLDRDRLAKLETCYIRRAVLMADEGDSLKFVLKGARHLRRAYFGTRAG